MWRLGIECIVFQFNMQSWLEINRSQVDFSERKAQLCLSELSRHFLFDDDSSIQNVYILSLLVKL